MSSWLRQTPNVQSVVKKPQDTPLIQSTVDVNESVSLEVKQFPPPEHLRQNRPQTTRVYTPEQSPPPPRATPVERRPVAVAERPVAERPAAERPTAQRPTAQRPTAERPTAAPVQRVAPVQQRAQQRPQQPPAKPAQQMKLVPKPSNPDVTVLIPLYNGFEFLEGSLESTRRQTFKNWVGMVGVNGHGATGEPVMSKVRALVASLGLADVFEVVNLPDVKGGAAAITKMAELATTPFVAHLDCDDIWLPKKLETQMKFIDSDDEVGIVGTMCRYFGDSSDIPVLPTGELKKFDFIKRNPMIHSSILIRRELAIYTDEFVAYDYDCWVRNMLFGIKIVNIDTILVFHRIHMKSFYNASGKQEPDAIQKKYKLA